MFENYSRNFGYIKEQLIVYFKTMIEYKLNIFFVFLGNFTYMSIVAFLYFVLNNNFSNFIYWGLEQFIFFMIFQEIFFFAFAIWFRRLPIRLLSGEFNNYILKPINTFVYYTFNNIKSFEIIPSIFYTILFIIYLFFASKIYFLKLFFTLILGFLSGIFYALTLGYIDSFAFFMKKNQFLKDIFHYSNHIFTTYPPMFLGNTSIIQSVILFVPFVYFSSFCTNFYFGFMTNLEYLKLLLIIIFLNIILGFCIYILWKFGLKRYEAFG